MAKTGIKLRRGYNLKEYQKAYNKLYWKNKKNQKKSNKALKKWRESNPDKVAVINKCYYVRNRMAILINQQLINLFEKDFNDCIELESCHTGITVKTLKELKKQCPLLTDEFYRQKQKFGTTFKQFISYYKPLYTI